MHMILLRGYFRLYPFATHLAVYGRAAPPPPTPILAILVQRDCVLTALERGVDNSIFTVFDVVDAHA